MLRLLVWSMLFNYLESTGTRIPDLKRVLVGGAACPPSMIATWEQKYKVRCQHAWGMTELSPTGVINDLPKYDDNEFPIAQTSDKARQGRELYGIELACFDDDGNLLPRDGKTAGRLKIRGNWVLNSYFKSDEVQTRYSLSSVDLATSCSQRLMRMAGSTVAMSQLSPKMATCRLPIVTRTSSSEQLLNDRISPQRKGLIVKARSGGEWISSIELEHVALEHPHISQVSLS
eukprot:759281-Hanusia_phi.AAC.3